MSSKTTLRINMMDMTPEEDALVRKIRKDSLCGIEIFGRIYVVEKCLFKKSITENSANLTLHGMHKQILPEIKD
jgi:hypothetical protein